MATQKIKKQAPLPEAKAGLSLISYPLSLITILLITAFVFADTLGNKFIENLDDNAYILHNEVITHLNWSSIKEMFSTFFQGNYHPLTLLSFAIEYKLFGLSPFAFHLTNYILHILNTMLVYLFLKRFTGKEWVATITALFFGIHPMHVESVAWITERKDVLYSFFFLLSLISYTKYLVTPKKKLYLIWTFLWFLMSLLSKPAAVCLPLVLVLFDYYKFNKISWKTFTAKLPFFVLALFFGILTILSQRSFQTIYDLTPLFSIFDRIFLICYAIIFYIFKAFVPFNLSVMHYYPVKINNTLPIEYYLALPVLVLLVWGIFYKGIPLGKAGRFKKELIFGFGFYLITIVLELQILPVGQTIVSERYSYIPYIGIFFVVGQFFSYVKGNEFKIFSKFKTIIAGVIIFLLALFSIQTILHNRIWKNGETLFTDAISKAPQYGWNWYALGNSRNDRKDYDTAIMYYTNAINLGADFSDVYFNRGNSENNKKDFQSAITDYHKVMELNPSFGQAYMNCGNCEKEIKNFDASINDYNKAIEFGLNSAYFNRGVVEDEKKDFNAAINDYTKALELDKNESDTTLSEAYFNRANAENEKMDFDVSINDYSKAIELNPTYSNAYLNRGAVENTKKAFDAAIMDFTKAIELSPNPISAYYNRGIVENEKQDFNAAIKDYTKALELDPTYAAIYINRGFAKLSINDKEGACKDWQSALQYGNPQGAAALNQYCK